MALEQEHTKISQERGVRKRGLGDEKGAGGGGHLLLQTG